MRDAGGGGEDAQQSCAETSSLLRCARVWKSRQAHDVVGRKEGRKEGRWWNEEETGVKTQAGMVTLPRRHRAD